MPFTQELPQWGATGTKPPQSKLDSGWVPGDKPPADWLNWKENRTYLVLQELQQNAIHKDQKGVVNGVATLGADGKVPATQLAISSDAGSVNGKTATGTLNTTEKTNLVTAINEAFTSASNGKTSIANAAGAPSVSSDTFTKIASDISTGKAKIAGAVRGKGGTVNDTDSMEDIADGINSMQVKQFRSGTATGSTSLASFLNHAGTAIDHYYLSVTGLPFKPSVITLYRNDGNSLATLNTRMPLNNGFSMIGVNSNNIRLTGNAVVNGTSFTIPISTIQSGLSVYWEIEE